MLDDRHGLVDRDVHPLAVEGDDAEEIQTLDAAEGEIELGVGDEHRVRVERRGGGAAGGVAGGRDLVVGQRNARGGCRAVGQDVMVGQQDVRRDEEARAAGAVVALELHDGAAHAVARAEEVERQQVRPVDDDLGPRPRRARVEGLLCLEPDGARLVAERVAPCRGPVVPRQEPPVQLGRTTPPHRPAHALMIQAHEISTASLDSTQTDSAPPRGNAPPPDPTRDSVQWLTIVISGVGVLRIVRGGGDPGRRRPFPCPPSDLSPDGASPYNGGSTPHPARTGRGGRRPRR